MRTYFPQQNRGPRQTRESSNAVYLDMAGGSAPPTYSECCESEWKGEVIYFKYFAESNNNSLLRLLITPPPSHHN
jgi:hypothetical protein